MSLDVYLRLAGAPTPTSSGIFIREEGRTRELIREEWDERFPDKEPVTFTLGEDDDRGIIYESNYTHNLSRMAAAVSLYQPLWCPEELGITHAHQLVELLRQGLARLIDERDRLQEFNPGNGWGDYEGFVQFVRGYLDACERYPMAVVEVSR